MLLRNNPCANTDSLFTLETKDFLIDRFMISYELNTEYEAVKNVCRRLFEEPYTAPGHFDSNVIKLMVRKETDRIETTPDNILKKLMTIRTGLERYIMDLKSFLQKEQSLHPDQTFEEMQLFINKEDKKLVIFTETLDQMEQDINILSPEGIKYKYPNGIEAEFYSKYNITISNLKDDVKEPQALNTEHTPEDIMDERE